VVHRGQLVLSLPSRLTTMGAQINALSWTQSLSQLVRFLMPFQLCLWGNTEADAMRWNASLIPHLTSADEPTVFSGELVIQARKQNTRGLIAVELQDLHGMKDQCCHLDRFYHHNCRGVGRSGVHKAVGAQIGIGDTSTSKSTRDQSLEDLKPCDSLVGM